MPSDSDDGELAGSAQMETNSGTSGSGSRDDLPAAASALRGALALSADSPGKDTALEQLGSRIGAYRLQELLGEGGCGVVYLAEQAEPIRRVVALKVIKPGMDSRQVIARFEAERQALALMDHPNIARVLDAGTTPTGRPYFVMELVRGVKITDYCNTHRLSLRERLELFKQVCHAVQHAHQKGVIHRDLKPANILVTRVDGQAVPKVIDFGIAKATQQRLTDKTLHTGFHQFIGTAAYMSPEQAELSGEDIDTRSDIYTLGVLLFELLTGRLPFEPEQLEKAGFDELRRLIRHTEPPRPSTRLSSLNAAERAHFATTRGADHVHVVRLVRGDLDWIVMKCLAKERARRYETAESLTQDIERYLQQEPVLATPPSRTYRLRKYVRRHKAAVGFLVALGVVLVFGVAASLTQAVRATRAEREQARLRQQAQVEAGTSKQVTEFLREILYGLIPEVARGRDTQLLREAVERTAARVGRDLTNQPVVEANLQLTLSEVYEKLGDYAGAEALARRALKLNQQAFGEPSGQVAESFAHLGVVLDRQGKFVEAEAAYRAAVDFWRSPAGRSSGRLASALNNLGNVLWRQDKLADAELVYREALEISVREHGRKDTRAVALLGNLAILAGTQEKHALAESRFREVLAAQQDIFGPDHPAVAQSLNNLGRALMDQGKLEAARTVFSEALAIRRKILDPDHPDLAMSLNSLGALLLKEHKPVEAETLHREALAIRRKRLGNEHAHTAVSLHAVADSLFNQNRVLEAEPLFREALAIRQKVLSPDHRDVAATLEGLADTLSGQGKLAEAESSYREAIGIAKKRMGADHLDVAVLLSKQGATLLREGRIAESLGVLNEALAIQRSRLPADHPSVLSTLTTLETALRRQTNSVGR